MGTPYLRLSVILRSFNLVRRARFRKPLLVGLGATLLAGAAPARAQAPAEATLLFHLAQEAYRRGEILPAVQWLGAAVGLDPGAPIPRLEWASVLLEIGDPQAAARALAPLGSWWEERPAGADDLGARYARLQGSVAVRRGDDDQAILWYERAAARAPYDLGGRAQLIGRYRERDDDERSLVHLQAAAALMPGNAELRVEIGLALLGLDRGSEAEAAFTEAARLDPRLERAWDGLGQARSREGDLPGAEEAFRRGLQVAPASAALYEHLGDALLGGGRTESALQAYERAAALAPHEPRLTEKVDRARAALQR
jgi:tetratricopeptide (TPR) repeat protein